MTALCGACGMVRDKIPGVGSLAGLSDTLRRCIFDNSARSRFLRALTLPECLRR